MVGGPCTRATNVLFFTGFERFSLFKIINGTPPRLGWIFSRFLTHEQAC